jgi:23S rRNA (cytosine1962-C5)-methyltransferase
MIKKVVLKSGKEKAVAKRHPWIFSGAIASMPDFGNGEILPVFSQVGEFLAQAYFHNTNSIAGRILSFDDRPIEQVLFEKIQKALEWRAHLLLVSNTNALRLINAEGDGLPGLIVDRYADVLVLQINTCGMQRLKPLIVEALLTLVKPKTLFEKSVSSARRMEGLPDAKGVLWGEEISEVTIAENGLQYIVSLAEGQKTGFFLDQRQMRQFLAPFCKDKEMLNCFSYSGGFSLHALKAGAKSVTSVDSCPRASSLNQRNTALNGFSLEQHRIVQEDVFDYLRHKEIKEEVIILDPPAFVKKRSDLDNGCRGYKEINRLVFEKAPPRSLLLSSSCSHHVDEELFQNLLFQAAMEAKREVQIVSRHIQALDHPVSLYHPEGEYLKSLVLWMI